MGVTVSSPVATSPFFLTTGIIGVVSFAFTVSTFLRVVWVNLETMTEAPHEVHEFLTTLRTELLEEKASIRGMRRQARKHARAARRRSGGDPTTATPESLLGMELDEVTLKTMGDTVKHLIRRFRDVEQPFLAPGSEGVEGWSAHQQHQHSRQHNRQQQRARPRRGSSVSPYYQHAAYASPSEKGGAGRRGRADPQQQQDDNDDEDDAFWAQRTQYAPFTLRRRMAWVWKKSDAQNLFELLSRVQIRRIARQVGGMSVLMHEYGGATLQTHDMLRRVEERMNTIVGIRRVD